MKKPYRNVVLGVSALMISINSVALSRAPEITPDTGGFCNTVTLQAQNGQYVVAESAGGDVVNANRDAIGPWEKFTLISSCVK